MPDKINMPGAIVRPTPLASGPALGLHVDLGATPLLLAATLDDVAEDDMTARVFLTRLMEENDG